MKRSGWIRKAAADGLVDLHQDELDMVDTSIDASKGVPRRRFFRSAEKWDATYRRASSAREGVGARWRVDSVAVLMDHGELPRIRLFFGGLC